LITQSAAAVFRQFAGQTIILNLDFPIAEEAATLRRTYRMKLADAVVAASALTTGAALATRNVRDFKPVRGLRLMAV